MATTKYLDYDGLKTVWSKVKEKDESVLTSAKTYADTQVDTAKSELNTSITNLRGDIYSGTITANHATNATNAINAINDSDGNKISTTYIKASQKGATNGVATLGADGRIPAAQLPSFVDDVIEGYYNSGKFYKESAHTTEITGETGKIYVDLSTNVTYRYTGNTEAPYCEISASLALGETSSTAYSGASGKQNRKDIDTLLGYFSNGIANKAKVLTDGTTSYDTADFTSIKSSVNTINGNYVKASNTVTDLTTKIGTDSKGVGYFYVTDEHSTSGIWVEESFVSISAFTDIIIGRDYTGKTYNESVYIYATESVMITPNQYCTISSENINFEATNAINLKPGTNAKAYVNGFEILTRSNLSSEVTAITAAELTEILK